MNPEILLGLLLATVRMSLPILFAASGGYFSEKSGVAQIALEAYLLIGAFTAAAVTYQTQSLILGYVAAGLVAAAMAQIFNVLIFKFKANSIVVGTGMNLLAMGMIPIVSKTLFESTGSTPALDTSEQALTNSLYMVTCVTILMMGLCYWIAEKSNWGLQVKFAGEKSEALTSVGVSPIVRRWQAVTLCALITGIGGAILSTYLASSYSPLMSAGRGFIALAAVIFAGWSLRKAWLVVLFFGFAEAIQIQVQNMNLAVKIPNEFIQTLPYLATLVALLILRNKQQAPKEIS
jgi:simple sugar transport system permease protein